MTANSGQSCLLSNGVGQCRSGRRTSPWTLTSWQKHRLTQRCSNFISSIRPDDVCALASRHNGNRPCHVFAEPKTGSYNVCFFVEFDAPDDHDDEHSAARQRWVARFAMPTVHDPVRKMKSEIATMKYVTQNTTIPIPHVHGYGFGGPDDSQNPTGLPFVLTDYIDGKRLCGADLPNLPQESSQRFYTQLLNILAQIRRQEFSRIGSLALQDDDAEHPWTLSLPPLTLDINDQQVYNLSPKPVFTDRTFETTIEYAFAIYNLLYNRFDHQGNSVYDEDDAKEKVYALQQFRGMLLGWVDPDLNYGPFVLMHGDLRPSNVLVDDDHNILAIIDWGWSRTVPVQMFLPPTWITGYDASVVAKYTYSARYFLEYMKLERMMKPDSGEDPGMSLLRQGWSLTVCSDPGLFIANALHRFCNLEGIYWDKLHLDQLPIDTQDVVDQYFKRPKTKPLLDVVKRKLKKMEDYQTELDASEVPKTSVFDSPEDITKEPTEQREDPTS